MKSEASSAKRLALRGVLVLLALLLNLLPPVWPGGRGGIAPGFRVPAPLPPVSATPFFHEEILNPDSSLPKAHVASICSLPGGRIAAAWYAGSVEGARDVAIFLSTRAPRESTWSTPRAIVTRESAARDLHRVIKKVGNAVLFAEPTGRLVLLYVTITVGGWSGSSLNLTTSVDAGATWTPSQRLTLSPFFNLSELVKNAPVALENGGWAVPIYHEFIGRFPEVLWLRPVGRDFRGAKSRISGGAAEFQPALAALNTNIALAFMRDLSPRMKITMARTVDAGKTLAVPEALDLPNADSGLAALRLADGRVLLSFNDSPRGRENLRLAISADAGKTWRRVATLGEEAGREFGYPYLMQSGDGHIHVVYAWERKFIHHLEFNPAWLAEQERASAP